MKAEFREEYNNLSLEEKEKLKSRINNNTDLTNSNRRRFNRRNL